MTDIYGLHLAAQLRSITNTDALDDEKAVSLFLNDLVGALGMNVLAGPITGREVGEINKYGLSGVVILYESHAAIHTYPGVGAAFLDIFSCAQYSTDVAFEVFRNFFGDFEVAEMTAFNRGRHWTSNAHKEMEAWNSKR